VHNALEPKNIAIDNQGHIVISDFSYSRFLTDALVIEHIPGLTMNEYRAPEVFLGWKRDAAADCWAFGMMMFYMFFGTVMIAFFFFINYFLKLLIATIWSLRGDSGRSLFFRQSSRVQYSNRVIASCASHGSRSHHEGE